MVILDGKRTCPIDGLIVLDPKKWYFMLLSSSKEEATPMYNLKNLDY